jgi:hypothetical protein
MNNLSGMVLTALLLGVLLAAGVAWMVAGLYRRRMLALMRGGPPPSDRQTSQSGEAAPPPMATPRAQLPGVANHRRATLRLGLFITGVSLLMGLTQSGLALLFVYENPNLSLNRLLILGLVYAWPMVMGWGLLRRWSWLQVLMGVLLYMLAMLGVVMLGSTAAQSWVSVAGWLGSAVVIPVTVALLMGASGRIRAVAPTLLPLFLVLASASVLMLGWMAQGANAPPGWVMQLVGAVGALPAIALLAIAPWLVLAWPVYLMGLRLAHAYRRKRFSDLLYLLGAYWFVVLMGGALPALESVGLVACTQLLPWLWIPLAAWLLRGWLAPQGEPPTLLVLRVFQQDAAVQTLFDRVVERWRLVGNTVLIAGTDLLTRTLDPDDLFTFLNRRLASRFIASEAGLAERLRDIDRAPDPDGRYRVNECYCFDTTWQAALAALVVRSDVVLMDLRGFQAANHGCRHELGVLAAAAHLQRVVLLFDARTDRAVAQAALVGAAAQAFVWVDATKLGGARANAVLRALLGGEAHAQSA